MRIIVIGGGISGLACGHGLGRELPEAHLSVLEASDRAGGVIGTTTVHGHALDDGPGGWLNRDDSTERLLDDLGLKGSVIGGIEANRRRFVWKGDRLRRFPSDLSSFMSTDLLSFSAKLRVLSEPFIPWPEAGSGVDTDVASLFERRLGAEAMRALIDPVLAGIYAGRPEDLSLRATLPPVARLMESRRSLVKQALASRRTGAGVGGGYASLREGMGALPEALASHLGDRLQTSSPVAHLEPSASGWRVTVGGDSPRELEADAVVLAAPAPVAAKLTEQVDREVSDFFRSVPTSPVAVVGLGFAPDDAPALEGYGHLVPSTETGSVLGVLWSSSIFEGRAENGVSLRVILGGWRDPDICGRSEEELMDLARENVRASLGITAEPQATSVSRHVQGLPQYRVGHLDRVQALGEALERHRGLFIIGNAVHGVGVNACTSAAARAVEAVGAYLASLD